MKHPCFLESFLKKIIFYSILGLHIFAIESCKVYSFTGASISPEVKTADIKFFTIVAPLAPPQLAQTLTEALKDKLNSQTSLSLVRSGGDLHYEGQVTAYNVNPIAIQGNETAASNRLTIGLSIKFVNNKNEEQNFEKSFSRFVDFPANENLKRIENTLIDEVKDQLIQDIFNESIANW